MRSRVQTERRSNELLIAAADASVNDRLVRGRQLPVILPVPVSVDDRDITADVGVDGQLPRKAAADLRVRGRYDALQSFSMLDRVDRPQGLLKVSATLQLPKGLLRQCLRRNNNGRHHDNNDPARHPSLPPCALLDEPGKPVDRGTYSRKLQERNGCAGQRQRPGETAARWSDSICQTACGVLAAWNAPALRAT